MTKDQLLLLLERPIAFHPAVARAVGSVSAGLFFCQLFYWSGRGADPNGWIFKNADEWTQETSLSRDQQRTARSRLKSLGVLQEKSVGMDPTLHFRIDFDALHALLFSTTSPGEAGRAEHENAHVGKAQQALGPSPTAIGNKANPLSREYAKTTTTKPTIDELFEASVLAEKAAGRPVRNPARFKMALRSRLESDGPNESDFENLATLRRVREREASQRKPEPASEIAKKTKKPPLPRAP